MPQLDEISVAIGKLQTLGEQIAQNQRDHQARDDERHTETQSMIVQLTQHVNHENQAMAARVKDIEIENAEWDKTEAERKAHVKGMWRMVGAIGGTVAFFLNAIILLVSGVLNAWLTNLFGAH